jgi:hypothetical protein
MNSMAGEIALMQAYQFGLGQLGKTPAAVGMDFILRPSGYSRCGVPATHPRPDEVADEIAKLVAIAKPEGIGFPEGVFGGIEFTSICLLNGGSIGSMPIFWQVRGGIKFVKPSISFRVKSKVTPLSQR